MGSHYLKDEEGNYHEYSDEEYGEMLRGKLMFGALAMVLGGAFFAYCSFVDKGFVFGDFKNSDFIICLIACVVLLVGGILLWLVASKKEIVGLIVGGSVITILIWYVMSCVFDDKEDKKTDNVEMTSETSSNDDISAAEFVAVAEEEPIPEETYTDADEIVDKETDEIEYQDLTTNNEEDVQETNVQADDNEILDMVEQMPSFPGGETALLQFLSSNVRYPTVAEENEIQGRVVVTFIVERDGSITEVKVANGVDPSLDREAVRVIKSMPKWKAGTQNGKPVRVKYSVPVTFRLS